MDVLQRSLGILQILAIAYLSVLLLVYVTQSRMVYIPAREIIFTPDQIGLKYEPLTLTTSDHIKIKAWYIPYDTDSKDRKTILFCHGNGGNISYRQSYIAVLHQLGFNLLFFDYRGYGESEGTPHEQGTYLDSEAAWAYLTTIQNIPPENILIYGESLGGGVASYLAEKLNQANINIGGLILGSSFTSIPDRARELFPFLPVDLLVRYRYPTYDRLPKITAPVLVIHSPQDEIIPFHHGQRNFHRANEPKQFLEIIGDHNTGFLESLPTYTAGIKTFAQL
ncbi:MAG: alpha/beta hydrolase [Pseudanabaenaceae cyanobacterium]